MNSPPASLRQTPSQDFAARIAAVVNASPSQHRQPPEKRRKVDPSPTPPASVTNPMSPNSSAGTAITVRSRGSDHETQSLSESVRDHMYENRLRYHAYRPGKYAFPNDAVEQDRDLMKHFISYILCDRKFYLSPVDDALDRGAEVLDLGTGPGHWPMEVAEEFPNSTFLGIDLSPIQPDEVPPNVHFMVDDIEHENGWDLDENFFDYIHLRHTLHSVRDRQELMQRAYRHLKPGGWFEIQELDFEPLCDDNTCPEGDGYGFRVFTNYLAEGMRVLGSEMFGIRYAFDEMRAAGFENVQDDRRKCPIGDWGARSDLRECGLYMRDTILDGLKGLATRPFRALGWTEVQIEMFLFSVRGHVREEAFHTYFVHRTIYGRKPLTEPTTPPVQQQHRIAGLPVQH